MHERMYMCTQVCARVCIWGRKMFTCFVYPALYFSYLTMGSGDVKRLVRLGLVYF